MKINNIINEARRFKNFLLHHRYKICKPLSFQQFCNTSTADSFVCYHTQLCYCSIRCLDDLLIPSLIKIQSKQFVCKIERAKIIGSSSMIITKKRELISDLICSANRNYKITDPALSWRKEYPIHLFGRLFVKYYRKHANVYSAINLVGLYSWNYYHFVYEIISKFYFISKCQRQIPESVPIIVDEVINKTFQMREILKLYAGNRKILFLKPMYACEIRNLYCLSPVHQIVPNYYNLDLIKSRDNLFNADALLHMRKFFVKYSQNSKREFPRYFYISRTNKHNRSYNEQELVAVAKEFGISVVSPEKYSAMDQFRLFSNAKRIIAASGAAVTNIICCKPGCRVLILFSREVDLSIFSTIARCFEIDLRYLNGESDNRGNLQSSYTIDTELFRRAIREWLCKEVD